MPAVAVPSKKKGQSIRTSPATTLAQALQVESNLDHLYKGIPILKICSNGRLVPRTLTLTKDHLAILLTHGRVANNSNQSTASELVQKLPIPFWTPSKGFRMANNLDESYTRFLDVADINSIVEGIACTRLTESKTMSHPAEESLITIFHHGYSKALHLVIANPQHRLEVVGTLRRLTQNYQSSVPQIPSSESVLRYLWYHVDMDHNQKINPTELQHVANILNLSSSKVLSSDGPKECTYEQLVERLWKLQASTLKTVPLWKEISQEETTPRLNAQELQMRLQGHQLPDITLQDAQTMMQVLQAYVTKQMAKELPSPTLPLSISQFHWHSYLVSDLNSAYDPVALQIPPKDGSYFDDDQYFDRPLSEYWINTSHNTYLTGDQVQSKSSLEAYWWSLERGCKCLELDCWDNSSSGTRGATKYKAVVYHGHTFTSKIFFRDILKVVHHYITQQNPETLPIILSLENHCSHPFQEEMAKDLKSIFGDRLYIPPLEKILPKDGEMPLLPSPNELKGKVVIKGKRPPDPEDNVENIITPVTIADEHVEEEDEDDPYDDAITVVAAEAAKNASTKPPAHKPKIVPALAKLTLFHGCKFKTFEKSLQQDTSHMHSIGETKLNKLLSKPETPKLWRQYNQTHMTRTYPAGFRVDSSNYNPILAWAMGCQLVALNFQTTNCMYLSLNDGRFRQAGGLGYVLKPTSVLENTPPRPRKLELRVVQGYCLPKPKGVHSGEVIDPYVRVELHDVKASPEEGVESFYSETLTTNVVHNNGFCPVFEDATKTFTVHNEDVAMLHFQVLDDDLGLDDKIATAAIPVNCLRQGYRSIPLFCSEHRSNQRSGLFRYASLLVYIRFLDDELNSQ